MVIVLMGKGYGYKNRIDILVTNWKEEKEEKIQETLDSWEKKEEEKRKKKNE